MKYVVAVSGGVDSAVMLDMLVKAGQHELVVAHVNHGIRADSDEDEALIRQLASHYHLPFLSTKLALGSNASEDTARQARHSWLKEVARQEAADVIATAHHQSDVIETIAINIVRGTGWRGLCSLRETSQYVRPLLTWEKSQIIEYAIENTLQWREDSTNYDVKYLRNYLRQGVLGRLTPADITKLYQLYRRQCQLLTEIETELMHIRTHRHNVHFLTMIDQKSAHELLRDWLQEPLEAKRLADLWLFVKTAKNGSRWSLDKTRFVAIQDGQLVVSSPDNC